MEILDNYYSSIQDELQTGQFESPERYADYYSELD